MATLFASVLRTGCPERVIVERIQKADTYSRTSPAYNTQYKMQLTVRKPGFLCSSTISPSLFVYFTGALGLTRCLEQ